MSQESAGSDPFATASEAFLGSSANVIWRRNAVEDGFRTHLTVAEENGELVLLRVFGSEGTANPYVSRDFSDTFAQMLTKANADPDGIDAPAILSSEQEEAFEFFRNTCGKAAGGEYLLVSAFDAGGHVFVALRGGITMKDDVVIGIVEGRKPERSARIDATIAADALDGNRPSPRR